MMDDLQDAIMAKGPIREEDLRNNYNSSVTGSRSHKNGTSSKLQNQSVGIHRASSKDGSISLTN